MRKAAVIAVLVVALAGAGAFGWTRLHPNSPATAQRPPAKGPAPSSPAATPTPRHPTDFQALVEVPSALGSGQLVLYDRAANSARVIAATGASQARFVNSTAVSYVGATGLVKRDLSTGAEQSVLNTKPVAYGWSPDGTELAYISSDNKLFLATPSGTSQLAVFPPVPGRDVTPGDEQFVQFSADGRYFVVVDTLIGDSADASQSPLQVRDSSGALRMSKGNSKYPSASWALWSRSTDRLYFWSGSSTGTGSIVFWDAAGGTGTFAAGLNWGHPTLSPDGRLVAFDTQTAKGWTVEVLDLASSSVTFTRAPRSVPGWLADDTLCYLQVAPPNVPSGSGLPIPTGKVLAYDFTTQDVVNLPFADINTTYGSFAVDDVRAL